MALVHVEERDINKLQAVKIIPKTYCKKCEYNYPFEMDDCKKCGHHLIKYPNYFQGKIRFQNCMGNLEYQLWESNKKVLHESYLKRQEQRQIQGRLYFPPAYSKQHYTIKNRAIRFLKNIVRKLR